MTVTLNSNGFVFYEGPSQIDGRPIVGIATGLLRPTANPKTGDMVQTWILRSDVPPLDAGKTGEDASVCGGCKHRPTNMGTCYVSLFQGPRAVYAAYKTGSYPTLTPEQAAKMVAGRKLRMGAYGDPVAIPVAAWLKLLEHTSGHTGYTHQWRSERLAGPFKGIMQASVDTVEEHAAAKSRGWQTFRVRSETEPVLASEMMCPASEEGKHAATCATCLACDGASKDVAIIVHGAKASKFDPA